MSNIIAVVWDFDKTLIDGYMQEPIFKEYGVNGDAFWKEVNDLPRVYKERQDVNVNKDTIYLNHFINYAKDKKFKGLTNEKLKDFGKKITFFPGAIELLKKTRDSLLNDGQYEEYGIKVEHYIVSTGLKKIIEGTEAAKYARKI